MKATHIVDGKEIVHRKPMLSDGYKTPSKSEKFEKLRERKGFLEADIAPEYAGKGQKVRTLTDVAEADAKKRRSMGSGGMHRTQSHR